MDKLGKGLYVLLGIALTVAIACYFLGDIFKAYEAYNHPATTNTVKTSAKTNETKKSNLSFQGKGVKLAFDPAGNIANLTADELRYNDQDTSITNTASASLSSETSKPIFNSSGRLLFGADWDMSTQISMTPARFRVGYGLTPNIFIGAQISKDFKAYGPNLTAIF